MPDESDYGVEIPPRDHGSPVKVPTDDFDGPCVPVVPAAGATPDTVTLEPKRFHTGIRVSPEYAEELRAARELTLCIMNECNERQLEWAAAIDAAFTATPPDDAAGRLAGFTLYGLPVVVNPQVPSPRGIVFGPDIVPPAVRFSPEYVAAVDEATEAAMRIMKEHNERLLGMATDADTPHVVES